VIARRRTTHTSLSSSFVKAVWSIFTFKVVPEVGIALLAATPGLGLAAAGAFNVNA